MKEKLPAPSERQIDGLEKFAASHKKHPRKPKRSWRDELSEVYWYNARVWRDEDGVERNELHALRNSHGPSWLFEYRLPSEVEALKVKARIYATKRGSK